MIAGLIVFASAPFSMAIGIRCHAVSPDSRRGLLWVQVSRHQSPERKRRGCFRAVAAVPASAPASRHPIKARSASDGTPGCWERPEMIAGWLVSAEAFVRMANGIRFVAESPDWRRGLL